MADLWVKYRNKKSGAEGKCPYHVYREAIKTTTQLTIVEWYDGRPTGDGAAQVIKGGPSRKAINEYLIENNKNPIRSSSKTKKQEQEKAPVKEPEAAKQAKANKEKASKAKVTKKEK